MSNSKLRRQKVHEKNREREMAIIVNMTKKAEEARVNGTLKITNVVESTPGLREQFEQQAMKEAGISRAITQENMRKACIAMCKIIDQRGPLDCRQQVLLNLPGEIRTVLQGRTPEQVFDFYWSVPEFRTAWTKLKFSDTDLKDFISKEVQK